MIPLQAQLPSLILGVEVLKVYSGGIVSVDQVPDPHRLLLFG